MSGDSLNPAESDKKRRSRWKVWVPVIAGFVLVLCLGGAAAAAFALSGSSLESDPSALGQVQTDTLGGEVVSAEATGPDGKAVAVNVRDGRLYPAHPLSPGEVVSLDVVVKRPSTIGWLVGSEVTEHLTVRAPDARVRSRWLTVAKNQAPRVEFSAPVRTVAFGTPGHLRRIQFERPRSSITLGSDAPVGTVMVAGAAQTWEKLGKPQAVTWFPAGDAPSVAATPTPGSTISPATPLRLTFSEPVARVLGGGKPQITPETDGKWRRVDSHTLLFQPSGYGAGLSTDVEVKLPKKVDVIESDGTLRGGRSIAWTIPTGSTLRLQQLLAQAGYLPVSWKPSGDPVARTPAGELGAAVEPPEGEFTWRYPHTPKSLREKWSVGTDNIVTEGALMAFQTQHELEPDGVAGPAVWKALLADAIDGTRSSEPGYSYVSVSETLPEKVTLWHNGKDILTVPGNTGIPGAETELGTFPVFEHLEETTMSGENPDGSHYNDPGVMWVSYFNGGDALHAFDRPSYGSPQSLGCVEMQLEDAAQVWPYTPVGTLVTVES